MFLRCNRRCKDGKEHRYLNIVENRRSSGGRSIQKQVLYLGEINEEFNDSQRQGWERTIELFEKRMNHHEEREEDEGKDGGPP